MGAKIGFSAIPLMSILPSGCPAASLDLPRGEHWKPQNCVFRFWAATGRDACSALARRRSRTEVRRRGSDRVKRDQAVRLAGARVE